MFYRYAAASALILASFTALGSKALADSTTVQFSGTVPETTTVTSVQTGTAQITTSGSPSGNPNHFSSASPVKMTVQTNNSSATITVSPPVLQSGPTPDPAGTTSVGILNIGSTTTRSDVNSGTVALPMGTNNIDVNMSVDRPDAFPAGIYTYVVNLTITTP